MQKIPQFQIKHYKKERILGKIRFKKSGIF